MIFFQDRKNRKLFNILVGAAWIDGIIQPEERIYLRRIAQELQLTENPESQILLSELKAVQATECYLWLEEYFADYSGLKEYQELLELVGGIIYCDGNVDIRETKLLEKIQSFDPRNKTYKMIPEWILRRIRKYHQKLIQETIYS